MTKVNRVAGALTFGTALLLIIALAVPSRALAQTPGQGQALGILLLLGLGPRPGAHPPAEAKKPDGAERKAARTPGKPARQTSDQLNGRLAIRSAEVPVGLRDK